MADKLFLSISLFVLCLTTGCPRPLLAANEHRSLFINRSLLVKAEAEYRELLDKENEAPSDQITKRLSDLRIQIQFLREDAERLRGQLPKDIQAQELMKELVHRKMALGSAQGVNPETEKQIESKISRIQELHESALAHFENKRYDKAIQAYHEIILLNPDDEEAYLLLGHTCLAAREYEKAGQAFKNLLSINPDNEREIPRLYENILVEHPLDDEAMTQLGFVYLLLGHAESAKRSFEEALKTNPANLEARRGLIELP